jgi:cysteine synthase
MIDLTVYEEGLRHNIQCAKEHGVILPTYSQMKDPKNIPQSILDKLSVTGLWDLDPVNLFRINWHNEPKAEGGLFGKPNIIEFPSALTGVPCRIIAMVGKWFPTGCHKVGASYGCLAPELVTGHFDALEQRAVWPSTGNFCRGGAFNSKLLGVHSIGLMPEGMSRERFEWLKSIGSEVVMTPGKESNVKGVFDKTKELAADPKNKVFNQFEMMGNHLWHYEVTASAMLEAFENCRRPGDRFAGACFMTGSAGTIGAGDRLKEVIPQLRLGAGEAVQCPTMLTGGYGVHRLEGTGDNHVPWIHNARNTDMVIAVDDADVLGILRLFNEPAGQEYLVKELGLDESWVQSLSLLGISGIANLICCIKMAKYYEFGPHDLLATVLTDSAELYQSRISELREKEGAYSGYAAPVGHARHMLGLRTDWLKELTYVDRRQLHNQKYYTWVEQHGKSVKELDELWYGDAFQSVHGQAAAIDELIEAFNEEVAK